MTKIWRPFTQMQTAPLPISILKGEGSYLIAKNARYIDGISSWWVNLHGHAHPHIANAIAEQAKTLEHVIFAGFTHPAAEELAERLLNLLPAKLSKVFFSDNGSTAVEVGLKMALQYWYNLGKEKRKIVCFEGGYHGDTFGAMSLGGKSLFHKPFWNYLFDVISIPPPLPNSNTSLESLKEAVQKNDVACFVFEPLLLGAGGMKIYKPEQLDALLEVCKEYEVLTIADEVLTGFGRTGDLFAIDQVKQKPDILCLSKGITGGFLPLGATCVSEEIYSAFLGKDTQKALLHGHSYTANPIACRSALASLDLLEKSSRETIAKKHREFCKKWSHHPNLFRCESIGTILVLEFDAKERSYFSEKRNFLYQYFIKKEILLRPLGNVLYVLPPYCITDAELSYIYQCIEEIL